MDILEEYEFAFWSKIYTVILVIIYTEIQHMINNKVIFEE